MSTIVEHNDVDITPLFNWSKEFEIVNGEERIPVFIRILGDADMGKARVSALRRSAELRKKLKDPNSDERVAYIRDIDDMEAEVLASMVIVFSMRDLTEKASKKLKIRPPKAPRSDAKTELHEKYQQEIDTYPERRQKELRELLDKEIESLRKDLMGRGKKELYDLYVKTMIDETCEQELLNAFKEWCAYLGSYKDKDLKERLFSSFDEFANLPSHLKAQFIEEYSSIELYGDNLKKLQRVTP